MKKDKESRIDLRFALIGPGTMWNLLYEGMDQRVNLRSTFRGKDEESVNALIKFGDSPLTLIKTNISFSEL